VLGGERLDRHAVGIDTARHRIGRWPASAEQLGAGQVRSKTDIGDGHAVADAEAAGARIVRQHLLDGAAAAVQPVAHPFCTRGLVDPQLLLQIFAHARHDERMRIHRDRLRDRARMCAGTQLGRQQRRLRIFFVEVFEDRE
jgi:hypothetical protein